MERHRQVLPDLPLAAQLAGPLFEPFLEEPVLEAAPVVGRLLDQHVGERRRRMAPAAASRIRIEMIDRDPPDLLGIPTDGRVVPARAPHAEPPQGFGVRARRGERLARLSFGVARAGPWHDTNTSSIGGRTFALGSEDLNPGLQDQNLACAPATPLPSAAVSAV
jgi:hypothetical protein